MNYTLFDLFLNAYNGNSFAQLQIVQRFQPLLKKYAALLKYEDAYSDLQLYLLELLHSGKLTKLQRKDDGTLVKYIESSIRHQYISLNSRKNAVDNSVIASVDEIDFDQMSLSSNDEYKGLVVVDQAVQRGSIAFLCQRTKPFIRLLHGRFPALRQTARFPADRSAAVPVLPAWLLPCPKHCPTLHLSTALP